MITQRELGWLAGIVEGEGSITTNPLGIHIAMSDLDVMQRVASLIGRPLNAATRSANWPARYKDSYKLQVHGPLGASWIMTLYPLLGERRQAAARAALIRWRSIAI